MAKDETAKRSPFFQMRPIDREGFCQTCNVLFMVGSQPMMHRFSKQIYCEGCAKGYESTKPGEVTTTSINKESASVAVLKKQMRRIESKLDLILGQMGLVYSEETEQHQQKAAPVVATLPELTLDFLWSQLLPTWQEHRLNSTVEIDHEKKEVRSDSISLAYQFKTNAQKHGYASLGFWEDKWVQA